MARIDPRQLQRAMERQRAAQSRETAAGRRASGAMAAVRENLASLRALQTAGFTWDEIASALADRGVRRRDGQPLTGRRLTALIDSVERQARGKRRRMERRHARGDLARPTDFTPIPLLTDAPSSVPRPVRIEPDTAADEEAIRRENLARIQDLLLPMSPTQLRKD